MVVAIAVFEGFDINRLQKGSCAWSALNFDEVVASCVASNIFTVNLN